MDTQAFDDSSAPNSPLNSRFHMLTRDIKINANDLNMMHSSTTKVIGADLHYERDEAEEMTPQLQEESGKKNSTHQMPPAYKDAII